MSKQELVEGIDYNLEEINGVKYKVFTEQFHLKRGRCCKSGCKYCPWFYKKK